MAGRAVLFGLLLSGLMTGLLPATGTGMGARAQENGGTHARLHVDLNKVETVDEGCRSFFLFRNDTDMTLTGFEMSLAVLDQGGVISRLLTINAAPLPARRTTLKLFDIPDMDCDSIGEVILHDIATCEAEAGAEPACFNLLALSSRSGIPFVP